MKTLNRIPPDFDILDQKGVLGDSEHIQIHDLKKIDSQLKPFGLELVVFENGAAYNWYVEYI